MATALRIGNHGEVFTRRWVVEVILDLVGYTANRDLAGAVLVEPACGTGAFLGPVLERLLASATRHGISHAGLGDCIQGFDLQLENVEESRVLVSSMLQTDGCESEMAAKLARQWVRQVDFLLEDSQLGADFVVGNPPYVRIEDLDPDVAATYRSRWSTMTGRADIYVPFIERSLLSLNEGGTLGFICADRWFRNSYGSPLRQLVSAQFAVEHVWPVHDVDAFTTEVSAYPAITVISRTEQGPVTVLDTNEGFGPEGAADATLWATSTETTTTGQGFVGHRLPHWFSGDGFWPAGSPARLALVEHLTDKFGPLVDATTRTKVGIGIATGADKIYCISDPDLVDVGRALPLATGADLNSGTFKWGGEYLANVWLADGSLIDLSAYPKLEALLETAGDQLRNRHTARKNPSNWHRTIDKVNPELLERPLLMMRDLGVSANPVLVPAGYYPHHNVYWVSSDVWDLEVLGGILLSRVAQAFVEAYCVRMRGGTLRFQAQYLRQIRVPDPARLDTALADELRNAFRERDAERATVAACAAFQIDPEEYELT